MKLHNTLLICALAACASTLEAQQGCNLQIGDQNQYIIENQQIRQSNFGDVHSNIQPMSRRTAIRMAGAR